MSLVPTAKALSFLGRGFIPRLHLSVLQSGLLWFIFRRQN